MFYVDFGEVYYIGVPEDWCSKSGYSSVLVVPPPISLKKSAFGFFILTLLGLCSISARIGESCFRIR